MITIILALAIFLVIIGIIAFVIVGSFAKAYNKKVDDVIAAKIKAKQEKEELLRKQEEIRKELEAKRLEARRLERERLQKEEEEAQARAKALREEKAKRKAEEKASESSAQEIRASRAKKRTSKNQTGLIGEQGFNFFNDIS